jgi:D-lactate dehydrogenase
MNDAERLKTFTDRLSSLDGLDEDTFERLSTTIERRQRRFGYDEQGRLTVAFFDARSYDSESFERSNQERFALRYISASLDRHTAVAAQGHKAVCIFVNDSCDAEVVGILAAQGVELVALRCAGFNNVDLDACKAHGISVARVPAYSPFAVAEHTVGLMLMLNRHLHHAYLRNRYGYFVLDGLTGFDMRGKTAGVAGTGKIGQAVVDIMLGFDCRVLAFDAYPNPDVEAKSGVEYVDPERLFAQSDIITLHVPLTPETRHIVNDAAIETMKDGVMLINTSRGELVDTRALIKGLKSGKIGAAGLDVYEEEAGVFFRDLSNQVLTDDVLARLLSFNNVVVTSHQAFLTHEALGNIADTTLENLREFESGKRGDDLTNAVRVP